MGGPAGVGRHRPRDRSPLAGTNRLVRHPWEAPLVTHLTGWLHRPEDLRFWLERPEVELVDTLGAELEAWVRHSLPYRLGGGRLGYAHQTIPTRPWIE